MGESERLSTEKRDGGVERRRTTRRSGLPVVKHASAQKVLKGEDVLVIHEPSKSDDGPQWYLLGVCDGHHGSACSRFVEARMWKALQPKLPARFPDRWEGPELESFAEAVRFAMLRAFDEVDADWCDEQTPSGTTASIALVSGWLVTVANVGDSHGFLYTGENFIEMTMNHRLKENAKEQQRLVEEGLLLAPVGIHLTGPANEGEAGFGPLRVWPGGLAVSRSIGDIDVPSQVVCAPHIRQMVVPDEGARLVLASDGLWDAIPQKKVLSVCRLTSVRDCAPHLVNITFRAHGGRVTDDTTTLVIDILPQGFTDFVDVVKAKKKAVSGFSKLVCLCIAPIHVDNSPEFLCNMDGLYAQVESLSRKKRLQLDVDNPPCSFPKPDKINFTVHGKSVIEPYNANKKEAASKEHSVDVISNTFSDDSAMTDAVDKLVGKGLPISESRLPDEADDGECVEVIVNNDENELQQDAESGDEIRFQAGQGKLSSNTSVSNVLALDRISESRTTENPQSREN